MSEQEQGKHAKGRVGSRPPPPPEAKGKIIVLVSPELEKNFRDTVYKKYGLKRGNITKAIEEAIKEWIKKNQ